MKVDNNVMIKQNHTPTERTREISLNVVNEPKVKELEGNVFNRTELEKKIESVNKFLEPIRTSVKFQFHDKLNEYYVEIVDSSTSEVIKEIPPKKFLDMFASMMESIGIIVDQKI